MKQINYIFFHFFKIYQFGLRIYLLCFFIIPFWGVEKDSIINWPRKISHENHLLFLQSRDIEIQALMEIIKKNGSFEDLYNHARHWRQEIAFKTKTPTRSYFGKDRRDDPNCLHTSLGISGGEEIIHKLDQTLKQGSKVEAVPQLGLKGSLFTTYTIIGPIQHATSIQNIQLTQIIRHEGNLEKLGLNYRVYFGKEEKRKYVWIHTPAKNIPIIFYEIEKIYKKYLSQEDLQAVMDSVARVHWWFCQATPCFRGSAALGEVLAIALLKAKNLDCGVKPRVLIDLQALAEEKIEKFATNYKSFYEIYSPL